MAPVEAHRVVGSGGCNRLMGDYDRDANRLRFTQVATTMMACPDAMDTESAFTRALSTVTSWRILGLQLEPLDDSGRRVARLQAVP